MRNQKVNFIRSTWGWATEAVGKMRGGLLIIFIGLLCVGCGYDIIECKYHSVKDSKKFKIEINQAWKYESPNPFGENYIYIVVATKAGYVQYRHRGVSSLYSSSISLFKCNARIIGWVGNPKKEVRYNE